MTLCKKNFSNQVPNVKGKAALKMQKSQKSENEKKREKIRVIKPLDKIQIK
jgi:hypothetical protein